MGGPSGEGQKLERAIRFDLIIAVCALLISALATAASWWQTRVVAQQLSAQVWPYVTLTTTVGDSNLTLAVSNDGLGPAVIKSFVLRIAGRPQHDLDSAVSTLTGHQRPGSLHVPKTAFTFASLTPGQVLRPSSTFTLFSLANNERAEALIVSRATQLQMELCYCSILATCWNVVYPHGDPQPIGACADRGADQLQPLGPDAKPPEGF